MAVIECINISRFAGEGEKRRRILDDITVNIEDKEIFTIIGPSGGGKTSLLRLMNRLDEPDSGEVRFRGKSIMEYPPGDIRRMVAMTFQRPKLFGPKVADDLSYPLSIDSKERIEGLHNEKGEKLLEIVGLDGGFLDRESERLSAGEMMRVAIARALTRQPEVLLLDEPTTGLDPGKARELLDTVLKLNRTAGLTIVAVTHRFNYARFIGHRTMLMQAGKIIEIGETKEFFRHPNTETARKFLQEEKDYAG